MILAFLIKDQANNLPSDICQVLTQLQQNDHREISWHIFSPPSKSSEKITNVNRNLNRQSSMNDFNDVIAEDDRIFIAIQ